MPVQPLLQLSYFEWSKRDLNPWPQPCEGCALPAELLPLNYLLKLRKYGLYSLRMAESVGFEPTVRSPAQQFSRLPSSTTPATLHEMLLFLSPTSKKRL